LGNRSQDGKWPAIGSGRVRRRCYNYGEYEEDLKKATSELKEEGEKIGLIVVAMDLNGL